MIRGRGRFGRRFLGSLLAFGLLSGSFPAILRAATNPQPIPAVAGTQTSPPLSASAKTYTDVFAYCKAVRNSGYNEGNSAPGYSGPSEPEPVVSALRDPTAAWRCMGGSVYGCHPGASGFACVHADASLLPTAEMRQLCLDYPNDQIFPQSMIGGWASEWVCSANTPVITRLYSTDREGYLAASWYRIRPDPSPGSK